MKRRGFIASCMAAIATQFGRKDTYVAEKAASTIEPDKETILLCRDMASIVAHTVNGALMAQGSEVSVSYDKDETYFLPACAQADIPREDLCNPDAYQPKLHKCGNDIAREIRCITSLSSIAICELREGLPTPISGLSHCVVRYGNVYLRGQLFLSPVSEEEITATFTVFFNWAYGRELPTNIG